MNNPYLKYKNINKIKIILKYGMILNSFYQTRITLRPKQSKQS